MTLHPYPTWLEINLAAVESNTRQIIKQTGVSLMAVVKANAYGTGAVQVAQVMLRCGATYLAVARGCEALALRNAGIQAPILLFGMPVSGEIDDLIARDITLSLNSFEAAEIYARRATAISHNVRVHLKVDTGMGRYGVLAEDALPLAQRVLSLGGIELEGIFTHYAMIDSDPHDPLNAMQLERFKSALAALKLDGIHPRWIHTAASAAALGHPETRFNMTRVGSALLGIRPFYYLPLPEYLSRVVTWKACLTSCRRIPPGWGISYGQLYRTKGEETIGVIPVGYGDGFRRCTKNEVIIGGKRIPVVGKVCADTAMIHLPKPMPLETEVVLLGEQGKESIHIEELSERWNTSQADVVASINQRVPRVYTDV